MPKTRVLVVDDAVIIRRIVSEVVEADPDLELAGWASNGRIGLAKIPQINPDCIILDVEMPEMDGLETLAEIRKSYPLLPVIMFSTLTGRGATKTLEALARGATDYVTKPANVGSVSECLERLRTELLPKIKTYAASRHAVPRAAGRTDKVLPLLRSRAAGHTPEIVVIAASTGGPNALSAVVPALPGDFPLPVVIVQHMPPIFTELFAKRLDEISALTVREAAEATELMPGHVYIAPGGKHLELSKGLRTVTLKLTEDPPENSCRPAADVLFRSAVRIYGGAVLGVVLTGMGQDGLRGCQGIIEAGGRVLAQDQASSVVWGMPGAVTQAGLPEQVLALDQVAGGITARCVSKPVVTRGV